MVRRFLIAAITILVSTMVFFEYQRRTFVRPSDPILAEVRRVFAAIVNQESDGVIKRWPAITFHDNWKKSSVVGLSSGDGLVVTDYQRIYLVTEPSTSKVIGCIVPIGQYPEGGPMYAIGLYDCLFTLNPTAEEIASAVVRLQRCQFYERDVGEPH